jgi:hypothetical protein
MKSYYSALTSAAQLTNMPDPNTKPGLYITWAGVVCQLLSDIYARNYDEVCNDLRDKLVDEGIIDLSDD